MRLRLGLVGLGDTWQQRHAPALRALADRFEIRAIYEAVAHRARQAAEEFQADAVDGFRALVGRQDVDAVLVLSHDWYGALPILAACEAGKAVYCAAGLELNMPEADALKLRLEQSGVAFVAEFPQRHAPATVRLKELIATRLGAPRIVFCHRRAPAAHGGNHAAPRGVGRPALRDLAELVDWCCYVVAQPPRMVTGLVHAGAGRGGKPKEDYQMLTLDFSWPEKPGSGAVAQISCGRYVPAHWTEAISYRPLAAMQISCARGIAFVDPPATLVWFDEAGRRQESLESERPVCEQALMQFFRAVTSLVRRNTDLEDAHRAMRIVDLARRSHVEGRRIEL
jgi:predicted dehydrogenase